MDCNATIITLAIIGGISLVLLVWTLLTIGAWFFFKRKK